MNKELTLTEKSSDLVLQKFIIVSKAISQLAKTVLSIPTYETFSAGAFAGANGILFEGLTNPKLLASFSEGISTSALLKLGPGSAKATAYRELLELSVVNSQVQIGEILINLLRDAGGANIAQTDALLKPFLEIKKLGQFFQGKYVAEDDTYGKLQTMLLS